jgi:exosortase
VEEDYFRENTNSLPSFSSNYNNYLAITLKTLLILSTTIAVFLQDFTLLFENALSYEGTSYILIIPLILAYLIYRKRKMVQASIIMKSTPATSYLSFDSIYGVLLILSSLLIYWYGSSTFSPSQYHILALPIFIGGCILIIFNIQTLKQLIFPLIFLYFLMPPPADILYRLGGLFSWASSNLAYILLKIFGFPAVLGLESGSPTIFITQANGNIIPFVVDLACSGIYSQIGFLVFSVFMAYIIRGKIWKKALVFLIGFPIIYLLNVVRIFSITVIGYYQGADLALEIFHFMGGWILIFLGTILLLVFSEKLLHLQILSSKKTQCKNHKLQNIERNRFCSICGSIQEIRFNRITKTDLIKIGGLLISVILVVSIQTPIFALTKGPAGEFIENNASEQATTAILPQISGYTLTYLERDKQFEQKTNLDYALKYVYTPDNTSKKIYVLLEIASAQVTLHGWHTCLSLWQTEQGLEPLVETIEWNPDVELLENPILKGNFFLFWPPEPYLADWPLRDETNQAVMYWYELSSFQIGSTVEQKKVKLSLVMYPSRTEAAQKTEEELLTFAKAIVNYWEPIKTWSNIMLPISKIGNMLFIIPTITLLSLAIYQILKEKSRKQNNLKVYDKLAEENKTIINALQQAEIESTLLKISDAYENISGKSINQKSLLEKLLKLQKVGLIKQAIKSDEDNPILEWKIILPKNKITIQKNFEGKDI